MADGQGLREMSSKAQGKGLFATVMEDLGLSPGNKNFPKDKHCVYKALYDAKTWQRETGDDVLVAISKIDPEKDINHAQAVAIRGDKVTPLTSHNDEGGKVREWNWHYPDKPLVKYMSVDDFLTEQESNLDDGFKKYLRDEKE